MIKGHSMCGDSGIDSILITNPARVSRQQSKIPNALNGVVMPADRVWLGIDPATPGADITSVMMFTPALNDVDLAESYVPFDPPTENTDEVHTEDMLGSTLLYILITGFLIAGLALVDYVAKGNAITSIHVTSHEQAR
jgi:hypothetical protein